MKKKHTLISQIWKRGFMAAAGAAAFCAAAAMPLAAEAGSTDMPVMTKAGSVSVSSENVTYDQPFAKGTAGSANFRIPTLITLENGDLLAAADARWGTTEDGGGLDSIAAVSSDGGATWYYSFPLFFPDSSGYVGKSATTIIDPGVVEGPDGTIYFIADVNPTGSTTAYKTIGTGTGYVTVNGERYLALTDDYGSVDTAPTDDDLETYAYYIDNFDENGYAQILYRSDSSPTGYGVDEWYNIYTVEDGEYIDNLTQSQVNTDTLIQQNAYYEGSCFHVYSIDYIWVVTSTDHGRTWEHPRNITDQIKRQTGENGILVSPGQGITTDAGDIVIGFYNTQDGEENASIVYSTDNGETWKRTDDVPGASAGGRWSSENEIVELDDGTLRMFYRNGSGYVCYADAVKGDDGEYTFTNNVRVTDAAVTSTCNVTAIKYSQKINGQEAILVAMPGGSGRTNGKVFVFLVEDDEEQSLTLFYTFSVPNSSSSYQYSCLTEMDDGTIGLLWESGSGAITFSTFSILTICPDADVSGVTLDVDLEKGETYTREYNGEGVITENPDYSVALVTASETGVTIIAVDQGSTRIVVDGVRYRITVTDPSTVVTLDQGDTVDFSGSSLTQNSSDTSVITAEAYNESQVAMFDHSSSSTASSLDSFSSTANTSISLSDAEFIFTGSDTTWQIQSASASTYLTNASVASTFFSSTAADMTVTLTSGQNTFRICKSDGTRYIIFYFTEMNFNANSSYSSNISNGSYELVLLEKQDTASDSDIISGYKQVTSITSGNRYLIAYIWNDGSVFVLYPTNGVNNQTKLAYRVDTGVRVTAVGAGTASVGIDGQTYNYQVTDPTCEHTNVSVKYAVAAECDREGYTGDTVCDDCGYVTETGETIPALSHAWDEGVVTKEVTETENGEIIYTCTNDPFHTRTVIIYASAYVRFLDAYDEASPYAENSGLYTDESVAALLEAYETGTQIAETKVATRSEMYKSADALREAVSGLVSKTADELSSELDTALTDAESDIALGQNGVSDDIWKAYTDAYKAAANISADATEEEIYTIMQALSKAQAALAEARNEVAQEALSAAEAELKEAISSADAIYSAGQGSYTADSWQTFVNAYNAAKSPAEDADADALLALASNLKAAQNGLKIYVPAAAQQTSQTSQTDQAATQATVTGIQAGDTATIDDMQFKVLNAEKKTAALVKYTGKSSTKVVIPATVSINGVTCTVTQIGAKAFKGCSKLKQVTIGKNVTTIGKQAFMNCKKLSKVTLKGTALKTVKSGAFKKTAAKVTVKVPKKLKTAKRTALLKKLKKSGMSKKSVIK